MMIERHGIQLVVQHGRIAVLLLVVTSAQPRKQYHHTRMHARAHTRARRVCGTSGVRSVLHRENSAVRDAQFNASTN
jgi:hypothetical protein